MKSKDLTICFFGIYNSEYSRNRILLSGLRQNGVKIIECHSNKKGFLKYFDLIKKHWKLRKKYDVLLVAFPGWSSVILAKFLTRKPIIFDAFISIYDSNVFDRKRIKKRSLKAKRLWLLDWLSCKLADKVFLDTNEHIKYFVKEFGIKKEKFKRIFVGSLAEKFLLSEKVSSNKFTIIFYGFLIPLQGVKYILEATEKLKDDKDIQFNIVGSKIKKSCDDKNFSNVNFIDDVSYEKLLNLMNESDVCLGIFGDTDKTQRVIANKIFDAVALKKPVITADTKAIRELFDDNDLLLIPTANSRELVRAILNLKNNQEKMDYLAQNSYNKFIQKADVRVLGKQLKKITQKLVEN